MCKVSKKVLSWVMSLCIAVSLVAAETVGGGAAVSVKAAEGGGNIIYVKYAGSSGGDGTYDKPYNSIVTAFDNCPDGGTIGVLNDFNTMPTIDSTTKYKDKSITIESFSSNGVVKTDAPFTIKSDNNTNVLLYVSNFTLTLKNITLKRTNGSTVVINVTGGKLIMENGSRIEGGSNANSVGVSAGSFIMNAGTITNTNMNSYAGVSLSGSGSFIMNGGEITKHKDSGVRVNTSEGFTMNGGVISDNSAGITITTGGGVYLQKGSFTMNGGTISNNNADGYGGGVYIAGSQSFTMSGGTISNNKATSNYGGGVFIHGNAGKFNMTGGMISNNTASPRGGGVYIDGEFGQTGSFEMSGGTISANNSAAGGGVYFGKGTFKIGGNKEIKISGNTGGNVYLNGNKITRNGTTPFVTNSSIGIMPPADLTNPVDVMTDAITGDKDFFLLDAKNDEAGIWFADNKLVIKKLTDAEILFNKLNALANGCATVNGDTVTVNSSVSIGAGDGNKIVVKSGVTLDIKTGTVTVGNNADNGITVENGGKMRILGGGFTVANTGSSHGIDVAGELIIDASGASSDVALTLNGNAYSIFGNGKFTGINGTAAKAKINVGATAPNANIFYSKKSTTAAAAKADIAYAWDANAGGTGVAGWKEIVTEPDFTLYYSTSDGKLHQGSTSGKVYDDNYSFEGTGNNTLVLGTSAGAFEFSTKHGTALVMPAGTKIRLADGLNNKITGSNSDSDSTYGIKADASLEILGGTGTLTVTAGNTTGTDKSSYGLYADGDITVTGGTLNANGNSVGVYSKSGGISITGAGVLIGRGDKNGIVCAKQDATEPNAIAKGSTNKDESAWATDAVWSSGKYTVSGNDAKAVKLTAVKLTITTLSLQDGMVGAAYSQVLKATGTAPIAWSIEKGKLPDGLSLSASGAISGKPTVVGTSTFTVKVVNNTETVTRELSIKIIDTPKEVIVGSQYGGLTEGVAGSAAFPVRTIKIAAGSAIILNNINQAEGIGLITLTAVDGSSYILISTTEDTPQGSYALTLTIDGVTSNSFVLTVRDKFAKSVGVGLQSGQLFEGVEGSALYTVNTANIISGAAITLNNMDNVPGITLDGGTVTTDDNPTIIRVHTTADTPQGNHPLTLTVKDKDDSSETISNIFYVRVGKPITPVTDITGVLTSVTVNRELKLNGIVVPADATNRTIKWSVKNENGTGAVIDDDIFLASTVGTAEITAEIIDGISTGVPFVKDFNIVVSAVPSSNSDSGNNSNVYVPVPSPTSTPAQTAVNNEPVVIPEVIAKVSDDTLIASIVESVINSYIEKLLKALAADENTPEEIEVDLSETGAVADSVSFTMPIGAVKNIIEKTDAALVLNAGSLGKMRFDKNALEAIVNSGNGTMKIVMENVGKSKETKLTKAQNMVVKNNQVYDLGVFVGSTKVTDFKLGSVTVSLPYALKTGDNPNCILVYYVDNNSGLHLVPNGKYDRATGTIMFTVRHFSVYMVSHKDKTFSDISGHWAKNTIEAMAARGFVSGNGGDAFEPDKVITRAEFAGMVQNIINAPYRYTANGYSDVVTGKWYYTAVMSLKVAGILDGLTQEGDRFNPDAPITREEVAVIIADVMKYKGVELPAGKGDLGKSYTDAASIAGAYREKVLQITAAGLMAGTSAGNGKMKLDPKGTVTRAQAAQFQSNMLELLY